MSWHVDPAAARRYTQRGLDPASAASLEAHVLRCGECRAAVNAAAVADADADLIDHLWSEIVETLDQPRAGWIERLLMLLGLSDVSARVVAATTRSRWTYLLAIAVSFGLALVASRSGDEQLFGFFLVVAPLGPLVASATAYGLSSDPAYDLLTTVPTRSLRMLLVRTAATVVPALLLTAIATLLLLDHGWLAVAWLLPSLALALAALALSTWVTIETAAVIVAAAWLTPPIVTWFPVIVWLEVLGGRAQFASVMIAGCAAIITALRHSKFDYKEA
jgi:hypothetical protein